jgi:hypothetical protein
MVWYSLYLGLARTIYIYGAYIYGIFSREIAKYTVIYGSYIRFWPTLPIPQGLQGSGQGTVNKHITIRQVIVQKIPSTY